MHGLKPGHPSFGSCQACLLRDAAAAAANRSMLPIHMLLRPRPTAAGGVTLSWEPADPNVTRAFVAGDGRWRRAADALADLCTRVPCAG